MHTWPKAELAPIYDTFAKALEAQRPTPNEETLVEAMKSAVTAFMAAHHAAGAAKTMQPAELQCAQCLQEVFERLDPTDEEYELWTSSLADAADY